MLLGGTDGEVRVGGACAEEASGGLQCRLAAHGGVPPCVDDPVGSRALKRILTGGSIAIMCPALLMRDNDRWPSWGSRPGPKQSTGFESHWWQRVLRIVGSTTDRPLVQLSHPGTDAWFRRAPAWRGRLSTHHRGLCQ
jgi:hypothetical protein